MTDEPGLWYHLGGTHELLEAFLLLNPYFAHRRVGDFQFPSCSARRARQFTSTRLPGCQIGLARRETPPGTKPACRPCEWVSSEATSPLSPCGRLDRTMPRSLHSMPLYAAFHRSALGCGMNRIRRRHLLGLGAAAALPTRLFARQRRHDGDAPRRQWRHIARA